MILREELYRTIVKKYYKRRKKFSPLNENKITGKRRKVNDNQYLHLHPHRHLHYFD